MSNNVSLELSFPGACRSDESQACLYSSFLGLSLRVIKPPMRTHSSYPWTIRDQRADTLIFTSQATQFNWIDLSIQPLWLLRNLLTVCWWRWVLQTSLVSSLRPIPGLVGPSHFSLLYKCPLSCKVMRAGWLPTIEHNVCTMRVQHVAVEMEHHMPLKPSWVQWKCSAEADMECRRRTRQNVEIYEQSVLPDRIGWSPGRVRIQLHLWSFSLADPPRISPCNTAPFCLQNAQWGSSSRWLTITTHRLCKRGIKPDN